MPQNKIITEHYITTTLIYALIGKKVHTNLTLVVDRDQVSVECVATLDPRMHLLQIILHN